MVLQHYFRGGVTSDMFKDYMEELVYALPPDYRLNGVTAQQAAGTAHGECRTCSGWLDLVQYGVLGIPIHTEMNLLFQWK